MDNAKKALADGRQGLGKAAESVKDVIRRFDDQAVWGPHSPAERELRGNPNVGRQYRALKDALKQAADRLQSAERALEQLERAVRRVT